MPHHPIHDVAIVGGGPAGLTAGVWLGRYMRSVALVDSGDPRNWETRGINGFTGHPGIRPAELRGRARDECRSYGVEMIDGFVSRVEKESHERFVVEFDPIADPKARENRRGPGSPRDPHDNEPRPVTQRLVARRLLLAFGLRDEWPKVPGLQQVYGSTAHVCPDCDGYETRGKKVCVIASGRRAVGLALALTTWTPAIRICTNGDPPEIDVENLAKLDALGIGVSTETIVGVNRRGDQIDSVQLASGERIDCDEIFFSLSQRPADDLGAQLACERDAGGHIVVDERGHTSVRNVWAAGDIAPGPQLAVVAAAEGAIAAMAIHRSLMPDARSID